MQAGRPAAPGFFETDGCAFAFRKAKDRIAASRTHFIPFNPSMGVAVWRSGKKGTYGLVPPLLF
ncbi:hypothetical protein M493_02197 [Geobacillus genomosp. 3]|uniref:Uncharacterized protein n=1 Tax=Geobacillus genomosp. 3 TaxID=1921421 RepID=V5LVQ1_GEOG3|nr:hypothetical protein M493_02197 [Geobacillus genomosp. 3]